MSRVLLIVFLVLMPTLIPPIAHAARAVQPKQGMSFPGQRDSFNQGVDTLRLEVDRKLAWQQQMIQTSFSGVSVSLESASHWVQVVGVIVAVLSIMVAGYVTLLFKKMDAVGLKVKASLVDIQSLKAEIGHLTQLVNSNLSGLYVKLREEETKYMVSMIGEEPRGITNFVVALTSRGLGDEYFPNLRDSYLSLPLDYTCTAERTLYLVLFFQHYAGLSLFDPRLAEHFEAHYYDMVREVFKKDILNATRKVIRACVDHEFGESGTKFIGFLGQVKQHATGKISFNDILNIAWEELITKENRFAFYKMTPKDDFHREIRVIYGKMLLSEYGKSENSKNQKLLLIEAQSVVSSMEA